MAKSKKEKKASSHSKSAGQRDAQVTIILGRNGTGKSTFAEGIVKEMGRRVVVVTLNGTPKIWRKYPAIDPANPKAWDFKGIVNVYYMQHEDDTMRYIHTYFRDGILLLDDCRAYIKANVDSDIYLKRLLIDFRHKMIDIFFVAHAPTDVPPRVWAFYSTAFVGATDALFPKGRISTDSAMELIEAQQQVNKKFRKAKAKGDNSHYGLFEMVIP